MQGNGGTEGDYEWVQFRGSHKGIELVSWDGQNSCRVESFAQDEAKSL